MYGGLLTLKTAFLSFERGFFRVFKITYDLSKIETNVNNFNNTKKN